MKTILRDIGGGNLERRNQDLYWDGCRLADLARQHGTPLYVVNAGVIEHSYHCILGAFRSAGLDARLFFSYKTNPVPEVLREVAAHGAGAEVISEYEFWLATSLGIAGRDIIVNGSVKPAGLLRRAVLGEVALINAESLPELRRLAETAGALGRTVNVGLRINPGLAKSRFDFTLATGSRKSHIGFTGGGPDWQEAFRILHSNPQLKVAGLQFHLGSGIQSARPYAAALGAALEMWAELLECGFSPAALDIGGGFGAPTLKEFNLFEAIRFFGWGRAPRRPGDAGSGTLMSEIACACATALHDFSRRHGVGVPAIFVEPGRRLVAASQLLLLQVELLKTRAGGSRVAVCDAGAMSLSPLLLVENHDVLVANKADSGRTERVDIVGNLPAPLDLIALGQRLPALEAGDILAVLDTGAYFTSLGNNFAGPRPAVVIIEKSVPRLIRRRESFEDMVARDIAPADPGRKGEAI